MAIKKATPQDLDPIVSLELQCFPNEAWSRAVFREDLARADSLYLLAYENGAAAGYIAAGFDGGAQYAHISSLAVDPAHQRQGIGTALLEEMLRQLDGMGIHQIRAETRLSNDHVQKLFLEHGFQEQMIIGSYYQHPVEDAVLLLKGPD